MALDLGSSTRHIHRCISGICADGCNAVDGPKDKQAGGIILFLRPCMKQRNFRLQSTQDSAIELFSPNMGDQLTNHRIRLHHAEDGTKGASQVEGNNG